MSTYSKTAESVKKSENNTRKSATNVQKLATMGMLCAIAYVCTALFPNIPVFSSAPYLTLDPKDAVIAIGGCIFGPLSAIVMSLVVSLVEMVTISSTGIIGCIMNVLSTAAFAGIASFIYSRKKTVKGAVIGLITGTVAMTAVMVLWNYLITPLYAGMPREAIVPMLPTIFLPFNLLKGAMNSAITLILYKFVVTALRKAKLLPESEGSINKARFNPVLIIGAAVVLISCILLVLVIKGIL